MSNELVVSYGESGYIEDSEGNQHLMYQAVFNGQPILFDEYDHPWMSANDIAEMFGIAKGNISRQLARLTEQGILTESTVINLITTAQDGKIRQIAHYDMQIVNVIGCRMQDITAQTLAFIQWAGFVLNDRLGRDAREQRKRLAELQSQVENLSDALTESEKAARANAHWDRYHYERNRQLVADLRHGVIAIDNWES